MTYEKAMGDLPVWMGANPFIYGAGPYAPGGPGGGMILSPGYPHGPKGPAGRTRVCVHPPMTPKGVDTSRGWPSEIGPQEEQLMDAGCVSTGIRCGGHVRAPSQYWDCPQDISFPGVYTSTADGFYGLGNGTTESSGIPWYIWPLVAVAGGAFLLFEGLHLWGEATGSGRFPR